MVEYVKLKYQRHPTFSELRITCMDGGPDDPEIVINFSDEGIKVSAFNPYEHHHPIPSQRKSWTTLFDSTAK